MGNLGFINIPHPSYDMGNNPNILTTFDPDIGYVHTPNWHLTHNRNCMSLSYDYNSLGFLDIDHTKTSDKKRLVLLGDSFTEGFGVHVGERVSDLLQEESGNPTINMGISGIGTTQEMEVYRKYRNNFDHSAILIGIYPENDFYDNSFEITETHQRPYWIKYDGVWCLEPTLNYSDRPTYPWFKKFLKECTYLYNAYLSVKNAYKWGPVDYEEVLGHYNYSEDDWKRLELSLREIKNLAGDKPMAIYTIPSKNEAFTMALSDNPLILQLKELCDELEIELLDVTSQIGELSIPERKKLYNSCESHWSAKGHAFATTLIYNSWDYFH